MTDETKNESTAPHLEPAIRSALDAMDARYDELQKEMSSSEVASNPGKLRVLSKEYGTLVRSVETYRELKTLWMEKNEARHMLATESDPQMQTLATAARLTTRYLPVNDTPFASACPVLFIYGQLDPNADQSSRYYPAKCRQNNLPYDCHFIPHANHSFFHYKWKEQILDISAKWLEKICERQLV